ncbi:hypothetical protein FJTKL_04017 [Diaporthe vaccinii]|uniref:Amidoligase enzyme n=1 Tax=Diaporthe vaccinii TaxID=105482 RepID=A0ABR4DU17_9PEZI
MRIKGESRYESGNSIALWTIELDGSIRKDHARQVSMEIVSPIMADDMTEIWRDAVKSMFCGRQERCGLHVHLKPSICCKMKDTRALSKAIVYFKPYLQALLPLHRARGNFYCKQDYTENYYLSSETIGRCFEIINDMSGLTGFKEVMNHDRTGSHTGYYAWNLTNLSQNVERQKIDDTVK